MATKQTLSGETQATKYTKAQKQQTSRLQASKTVLSLNLKKKKKTGCKNLDEEMTQL